nr:hypothetical protein Iba_chr06fCG6590 [Ipomoea batatas]
MTVKVSSFQTLWGNALEYLSELAFEALHICFQRIHGPPQQTNWSHSVFLKSKANGVRIGGSTSMPILAAVPAIILMADSMVVQLRNDITGFISSPGIVVLTESHNVDTFRTQCRPNRLGRSHGKDSERPGRGSRRNMIIATAKELQTDAWV